MKELLLLALVYFVSEVYSDEVVVIGGPIDPVQRNCPKNAVYSNCGSACPTTCANMYQGPRMCIFLCKPGCVCNQGYVWNRNNKCVQRHRCNLKEIKCLGGKVYKKSRFAQRTCENLNQTQEVYDKSTPGCYCPDGLVLDYTQTCINPDRCELAEKNYNCSLTDYNSEYVECQSSSCIKTCDRPNEPCTTKDCRQGCFCKEGFVEDTTRNWCVPLDDCPKEESTTTG